MVVAAHPFLECLGCHGEDFTFCQGFVRCREVFLAGEDLEIADEVWDVLLCEGIALSTGEFIADAGRALGQDVDMIGALSLAHDEFAGTEGAATDLRPDALWHEFNHLFQLQ